MNRPTTKQIDQWLAGIASRTPMHSPESEEMVIGLAAEVRALREELTECEAEFRAPLRATIARVEALPAKWREWAARPRSPLFTNAEHALAKFTFEGCADQLEAALRG